MLILKFFFKNLITITRTIVNIKTEFRLLSNSTKYVMESIIF